MKGATKELDPAIADFLEGFSKTFASMAGLSIPEQRAIIKEMSRVPESQLEPIARVEDKIIKGRNGSIDVRLFYPTNQSPLPVIVYFHRGGWVYGSVDESEMLCRRLAKETGAIVAAVEFRLSPEYKFPIPLEDCYDATQWIAEHASTFSGDPSKVILCGESAGGNLAASVALMLRKTKQFKVVGQVLVCPILTSDLEKKHYEESPDKALISYGNMQYFWSMYLPTPEEGDHPFASPLKNDNFADLPPCLMITAEHDALKHEGASYAKLLKQAGVKVQATCYPGVIHGFIDSPLSEAARKEALREIASWVKKI